MATVFFHGQLDYIQKLNELWDLALAQGGGIVETITVSGPLVKGGTATDVTLSMPAATGSNNGYMTSAQAAKLAGIANNANNYVLPAATNVLLGGIKVGAGLLVTNDGELSAPGGNTSGGTVQSVQAAAGSNLSIINQTTNPVIDVGLASASIKGFMSPTDKQKLDAIREGGASSISSAPPANPFAGQQWIDSQTGIEFTWYFDGVTAAWVEL